jgi:hypothetical protein
MHVLSNWVVNNGRRVPTRDFKATMDSLERQAREIAITSYDTPFENTARSLYEAVKTDLPVRIGKYR